MYLTTIRVRRTKVASVEGILSPAAIAPYRNGNRLDLLEVCAGGKTVALVAPGPAAQTPSVVWQLDEVLIPATDLIVLVKAAITLMDQSGKTLGHTEEDVAPSNPAPPTGRRSRRAATA